ncbi:Outer membrane scaffolding protein for murein synthesis, MipA/OmpV family [Pseudomonas synxantha]|uniref:MltA-interacting MipA family protein n=1 Tax=Pseudomonas synxantha TaxID=47883 RepID=A0AAX3I5R1_9PSED|nr:MipA/OmpV family protein [Pseudomonas synxantha]AZE67464.1 Outer membrane protein V [Pseudomonas synxantha]KRP47060.1 structural protein MipA [Pseudomonas synxantha]SDU23919.1 Outer membrane scaffolding protein for murein synthesis, MipA/OmpV family [Pseudomonas synxantha]VTQ98612.1 MltA-interacting MipA family protein [Pseudomonas synxantha]
MYPKNLCLSFTSLCLLATAGTALAEDWQYSLKAGVGNAPRYSGSDERMTAPVLGGKIISPWGIFLDTDTGLGWAYEGNALSLSAYVGASDSRKDKNQSMHAGSKRLKGMGEIKSRPQLGMNAAYNLGGVIIGATLEHALKEDDHKDTGKAYTHLELSLGTNLYEGRFGSVDASLNSHFGDRDYLQTWYGVTTGQAARSRFKEYKAAGGNISNGMNLVWSLPINEHTQFSTLLDVQYLADKAGKSPIVERRLQTSVMGMVEYTF